MNLKTPRREFQRPSLMRSTSRGASEQGSQQSRKWRVDLVGHAIEIKDKGCCVSFLRCTRPAYLLTAVWNAVIVCYFPEFLVQLCCLALIGQGGVRQRCDWLERHGLILNRSMLLQCICRVGEGWSSSWLCKSGLRGEQGDLVKSMSIQNKRCFWGKKVQVLTRASAMT